MHRLATEQNLEHRSYAEAPITIYEPVIHRTRRE
jgi:hypothetical protein